MMCVRFRNSKETEFLSINILHLGAMTLKSYRFLNNHTKVVKLEISPFCAKVGDHSAFMVEFQNFTMITLELLMSE